MIKNIKSIRVMLDSIERSAKHLPEKDEEFIAIKLQAVEDSLLKVAVLCLLKKKEVVDNEARE